MCKLIHGNCHFCEMLRHLLDAVGAAQGLRTLSYHSRFKTRIWTNCLSDHVMRRRSWSRLANQGRRVPAARYSLCSGASFGRAVSSWCPLILSQNL